MFQMRFLLLVAAIHPNCSAFRIPEFGMKTEDRPNSRWRVETHIGMRAREFVGWIE